MVSRSSRKKIAVYGIIAFILSRFADAFTTWYYSPDLKLEGNPLFYAQSWERIWIVQAIMILILTHHCYRLATADYNKPLQGEWFLKIFFSSEFNTPIKRYVFELSLLVGAVGMGVIAVLFWILVHGLSIKSANYFVGIEIGNVPIAMPLAFFVPCIISYKLLDWYFAKQYNPCVN